MKKLWIWRMIAIPFLILLAAFPARSQTVIDGVVLDSSFRPVGGVDVSLYVVGKKDPIASQKSDLASGQYRFDIRLKDAFDIVFVHSRFQMAIVNRLAEQDNQHVSKVIYLKGEAMPPTAVDDELHSASRFVFLAASLTPADRKDFLQRFNPFEISTDFGREIRLSEGTQVTNDVRSVWEQERSNLSQMYREVLGVK